jgi:hypothetical protein
MPGAAWILLALGSLFLLLGLGRVVQSGWPPRGQARTWLLVGTIFLVVVLYLRHVHGAGLPLLQAP